MNIEKMQRVSRKRRCPVCGKPDWCLVAEDSSAAICPRIQEGSVKKCGDAGWLHILSNSDKNRHKQKTFHNRILNDFGNYKDFCSLAKHYQQQLTPKSLNSLAGSLGVSKQSLERLRVGWDGEAYTFPMSDDVSKIIGVRRRFPSGRKVSIKGSKTGLFIPSDLPADKVLLICEGPTDTSAALDLGFAVIGRPSCNSGTNLLLRIAKGREVVIIGDNDDVGKAGAEKLAAKLVLCCPNVRIIYPPDLLKDLRKWLNSGLTAKELQDVIDKAEPVKTKVRFIRKCFTARRLKDGQL